MATTLLLYHSGYGYTRRIAERIRDRLIDRGEQVRMAFIDDECIDPAEYDRIIIGASVRNGKHGPPVHDLIRRNQALLDERPSGFFSVNLVARKPSKNTPETNPYLSKFLEQTPWNPDLVAVFAGNVDYPRYGWLDRNIIRMIMWMTSGPTDPRSTVEFTDWKEVDRFADKIAAMGPAAGQPHRAE